MKRFFIILALLGFMMPAYAVPSSHSPAAVAVPTDPEEGDACGKCIERAHSQCVEEAIDSCIKAKNCQEKGCLETAKKECQNNPGPLNPACKANMTGCSPQSCAPVSACKETCTQKAADCIIFQDITAKSHVTHPDYTTCCKLPGNERIPDCHSKKLDKKRTLEGKKAIK